MSTSLVFRLRYLSGAIPPYHDDVEVDLVFRIRYLAIDVSLGVEERGFDFGEDGGHTPRSMLEDFLENGSGWCSLALDAMSPPIMTLSWAADESECLGALAGIVHPDWFNPQWVPGERLVDLRIVSHAAQVNGMIWVRLPLIEVVEAFEQLINTIADRLTKEHGIAPNIVQERWKSEWDILLGLLRLKAEG